MWKEINYKDDVNDLLVPNITYKVNPAEIESIETNSIAQEIGFESGDSIISFLKVFNTLWVIYKFRININKSI